MPRPRAFDADAVLLAARDTFVATGYAGTSIDDLVRSTGLQRSSLYNAFGSKRGLFVAVLGRATSDPVDLDVLVVALLDLAGDDASVRDLVAAALGAHVADAPRRLGERLLVRGGLDASSTAGDDHTDGMDPPRKGDAP